MQEIVSSIIDDEEQFQLLADDWNRLAHRTDENSVFLRHEWSDASWQWLKKEGHELCIILIRRDEELIGLCPLICHRLTRNGIRVRELASLAIPDSQEFCLLADPADLDHAASGLMTELKSGAIGWDIISLEKLPTDLPARKVLCEAAVRAGYVVHELQTYENPGIGLQDEWDAYYGRRSRRLKKGNNLVRNRLNRDGKVVEIRCYDSKSSSSELLGVIKTLTDISASSWKASTGLTLENPGPAAFVTRLSEHAVQNSWILVWLLTIDQEPVAMEFQLEFNGIVSGLRADYDGKFDEYSPGTFLNWRIIEQLFSRGASYYALGPGSNPYKARWVEDARDLVDLVIYGDSVRARGLRMLDLKVKPFVKQLLGRKDTAGDEG